MKKVIFFGCFLLLSACHSSKAPLAAKAPNSQDLKNAGTEIVGGSVAANADSIQQEVFEYQTFVPKDTADKTKSVKTDSPYDIWECTTSALSPRIFLLAAHCIEPTSVKSNVIFIQPDGSKIAVNVLKAIAHPDYNDNNSDPDLALILLEKDAPANIHIMALPSPNDPVVFTQVRAAGFGYTSGVDEDNSHDADLLRFTNLDVKGFKIDSPNFTIDQSNGHGICQGDSGGSAVITYNNAYYTVGVASETLYDEKKVPVDFCNDRGLFVNVQYYNAWLSKNIAELTLLEK